MHIYITVHHHHVPPSSINPGVSLSLHPPFSLLTPSPSLPCSLARNSDTCPLLVAPSVHPSNPRVFGPPSAEARRSSTPAAAHLPVPSSCLARWDSRDCLLKSPLSSPDPFAPRSGFS
ncbi:hypothetical protein CRG98_018059, partial [Punica granatum]